jgi:uncharacterized repeat protein (TIGR03803 family)
MTNEKARGWLRAVNATVVLSVILFLATCIVLPPSARAQTFQVIHNFSRVADGANPNAGLAMDRAGRLYGTAFSGGAGPCQNQYGDNGCGTVFELAPRGSAWLFNRLYSFSGPDGAGPQLGSLTIATDGSLYGTTVSGGGGTCSIYGYNGCGTVFNLRPSPRACASAVCPWNETLIYLFTSGIDGNYPDGAPVFDRVGNLYGVADSYPFYGNIYELSRSGGSWTHTTAYAFSGQDGQIPVGEPIFDGSGNLYGTTWIGGAYGRGAAYQLTPSGSGWANKVLHSFQDAGPDGGIIYAGLILDGSGNLFGATTNGGTGGAGTIFELTPSGPAWIFTVLYSFVGQPNCGPYGDLVLDNAGNLYGTTLCTGSSGMGTVFKLGPSGGGWTYTSVHNFTGGSDGANPYCNVVFDAAGNMYGTTFYGGSNNDGVIFEITP